jgi:maltooligosyltrehalose trehalohydrolase
MQRGPQGYYTVCDHAGREGDRYRFVVNGSSLPDPGSHAQVNGVHSWSVVVDHSSYPWGDAAWRRPAFRDLVIYELHVGTFTSEGTFRAAIEKLPHIEALGVNAIEIMPIADFPGKRSWGYDGVLIYAPAEAYGSPDEFRALVDAAHQLGIAVILDVAYNHLGPDGNYLGCFSTAYFNADRQTPWGASLNFDGVHSGPVRNFFATNPIHWMEHYHIDGFRLDATHEIFDASPRHILQDIAEAVHARGGYVISEDCRNQARLVDGPNREGYGLDAVWADDFHHVARVGQTRENEAYYASFQGTIDELVETLENGWLYRGQRINAAGKAKGTECRHLEPSKFLHCISNHDQVGNRAFGERLSESITPEAYRAFSMLLCLTPYTPMLFMGRSGPRRHPSSTSPTTMRNSGGL